jgi:hypothetical protein
MVRIEQTKAALAAEMVMVRLFGDFVPGTRLAREIHFGDFPGLNERVDHAIHGGDSDLRVTPLRRNVDFRGCQGVRSGPNRLDDGGSRNGAADFRTLG